MRPKGLLVDYGGTLVEETSYDARAGNAWLLARAAYRSAHVTLEQVMDRANRITRDVAARRDQFHVETTWPALTRLIYDALGIRFDETMAELEMGFWKASVRTRPMPGAREALDAFHRSNVPIGVVSNCAFGSDVIRYELAKHGLAEHLAFVTVSAEFAVRKPHVLIFEAAAARLGVDPKDIWFVGDGFDTDIVGAKAAGMTAVWFQPSGREAPPTHHAELTVARWEDLVRMAGETANRIVRPNHRTEG